ncbi:hypothetical protein D9757_013274 [Collybiopsis confluens]|uniref:Uncharacterized protein n=1 Tax=Collybiopsis confluens TaxID=2823264 RepID=A0A8H5D2X9_9AGAR|nr:hypothetical protein D9757_013274 [Collybiopsis confluens]
MRITSAYLLACLFSIGYAFPVEHEHSIRAPPKASSAPPVIKVQFTGKTTPDATDLARDAEKHIQSLFKRTDYQAVLGLSGSNQIKFTNHNGESREAKFVFTGPPKCAKVPCEGQVDMESPAKSWLFITPENNKNPLSEYRVD